MTTKEDIREWLERGKREGATHLIVACDTFDRQDFPVFVKPGEDVRVRAGEYESGTRMLRLMEVYSLAQDWETQLNEPRAFHYD